MATFYQTEKVAKARLTQTQERKYEMTQSTSKANEPVFRAVNETSSPAQAARFTSSST